MHLALLAVVLACIAGNLLFIWLARVFMLPFFLDSLFSISLGFIAGPWLALSVGFGTGILMPIVFDLPVEQGFLVLPLALSGFLAGVARKRDRELSNATVLRTGLILIPLYAVLEAAILSLFLDGLRGTQADAMSVALHYSGIPMFFAILLGGLLLRSLDLSASLLVGVGVQRYWRAWTAKDAVEEDGTESGPA